MSEELENASAKMFRNAEQRNKECARERAAKEWLAGGQRLQEALLAADKSFQILLLMHGGASSSL